MLTLVYSDNIFKAKKVEVSKVKHSTKHQTVLSEKKVLSLFQKQLLDDLNLSYSIEANGEVILSLNELSTENFVKLLGAGCFTYHLETERISEVAKHNLMFKIAKREAHRFIKKEDKVLPSGKILKQTIVLHKNLNGMDLLTYLILDTRGVDTGMYKIAWGSC